jgi:hypothetical protein
VRSIARGLDILARRARGQDWPADGSYHNQRYAPLGNDIHLPETVTVVDPRHPLYDQTFPLLHLTNARNLIPCCVVRLTPSVERLIPIAATDLAPTPPAGFPSPLDLSSLERLITTFHAIQAALAEEEHNEPTGYISADEPPNSTSGYLGDSQCSSTSGSSAPASPTVLPSARAMGAGARS